MRHPLRQDACRHQALLPRHLAGQIYRQVRAGIVNGRLAPGERLPSTRTLASQLGVSRTTTLDVFERLMAKGYLRSRTFLCPTDCRQGSMS